MTEHNPKRTVPIYDGASPHDGRNVKPLRSHGHIPEDSGALESSMTHMELHGGQDLQLTHHHHHLPNVEHDKAIDHPSAHSIHTPAIEAVGPGSTPARANGEVINMTYFHSKDHGLEGSELLLYDNRLRSKDDSLLELARQKAVKEPNFLRNTIRRLIKSNQWGLHASNSLDTKAMLHARSTPILGVVVADENYEEGRELKKILSLELKHLAPFCDNRALHLFEQHGHLTPCKALWRSTHNIHFCYDCSELHKADTIRINTIATATCASNHNHTPGFKPLFDLVELAHSKWGPQVRKGRPALTCLFCKDLPADFSRFRCPKVLFSLDSSGERVDSNIRSKKYSDIELEIEDLKRLGLWHSSAYLHKANSNLQKSNWISVTSNITSLIARAVNTNRRRIISGDTYILCMNTGSHEDRVVNGWEDSETAVNDNLDGIPERIHEKKSAQAKAKEEYLLYKGLPPNCISRINLFEFLKAFPKPNKAREQTHEGSSGSFKDYVKYFVEVFDLELEGKDEHQISRQIARRLSVMARDHEIDLYYDLEHLIDLFKKDSEAHAAMKSWRTLVLEARTKDAVRKVNGR